MYKIEGKFGKATIFSDNYQDNAVEQVKELLDQDWTSDLKIRIMPDYHAGSGCVIGTTMEIKDKIVPNLVGVDIGCGMLTVGLGNIEIDFKELDEFIINNIPSGFNINDNKIEFNDIKDLTCFNSINEDRALKSLGTLGGGNHFIEIDVDIYNNKYLIIHTGSRYLGKQIAEYHQKIAIDNCNSDKKEIKDIISKMKLKGLHSQIEETIKNFKSSEIKIKDTLCYLEKEYFNDYINDMGIAQKYAEYNRDIIASKILEYINVKPLNYFHTIHNYIDIENMILRKGAISAKLEELLLIPINMRDGCILGKGLGNEDFNQSAPHGAGRLMSRRQARDKITLEEFKDSMFGIYTSSVVEATIDESPMAYKSINEIRRNIRGSVEVLDIIKPIYSFKNSN